MECADSGAGDGYRWITQTYCSIVGTRRARSTAGTATGTAADAAAGTAADISAGIAAGGSECGILQAHDYGDGVECGELSYI